VRWLTPSHPLRPQDIDSVLSTRMIFTGSAQEGPRNFFTK